MKIEPVQYILYQFTIHIVPVQKQFVREVKIELQHIHQIHNGRKASVREQESEVDEDKQNLTGACVV